MNLEIKLLVSYYISVMNVNKFGLHIYKYEKIKDNKCHINLCIDGNLDAQNKTLKNLKNPTSLNDSATKYYVDKSFTEFLNKQLVYEAEILEIKKKINFMENIITQYKNEQKKRSK